MARWMAVVLACASPALKADAPDGQAGAAVSGPQLTSLLQRNPFDPDGQLWPDRKPLLPPPPPPAPVGGEDLEVVGVVAAPGVQRAWVKLGPRFAGAGAASRGVVALGVGAALGEYTLAQIQPDQVLLRAPGGVEQWVRVYAKSLRAGGPAQVATSAVQPAPSPGSAAVAVSSGPIPGGTSSSGPAAFPSPGSAAAPAEPAVAPVQPAGGAPVPAPPGSLAAAIEAARAAAAQNGAAAPQAPALVNPFEALIKQQQSIKP